MKTISLSTVFLTVCSIAPFSAELPAVKLTQVAEGFAAPTVLASVTDGSNRLYLGDQLGLVYCLDSEGAKNVALDLRARMSGHNQGMDERGLLGLALHPSFINNGKVYVAYSAPLRNSAPAGWNHTLKLSEFQATWADRSTINAGSERVLMEIDQPNWNHNSGRLAFGPDGYLYFSLGDGSAGNDEGIGHVPGGNGQSLGTFLGKVLRLDVDGGDPYGIPPDNPFADGVAGRPEIYAYGLRNPWGFSFDKGGNHDLILVDVGQDRWEEINLIVNGGNYGWKVKEGYYGFRKVERRRRGASQNDEKPDERFPFPERDVYGKPFVDPVAVYRTSRRFDQDDAYGVSITGGYVYRGSAVPELQGNYVFADWSKSMAFGYGVLLVANPAHDWAIQAYDFEGSENGRIRSFIWSLGEDEKGELYVMTNDANRVAGDSGRLYRIDPVN